MHQIKPYCRTAFQFLIVVLFSSCLVVWHLIKSILARKVKQEETEEVKSTSIGENSVAPVVSAEDELGNKPIEAEEETDGIKSASIGESSVAPVVSPEDELRNQTVEAEKEATNGTLALEATEAYCVKCRQKQTIQGARKVTTKKGRAAIEGTCAVCGTKLFRFTARAKENLAEKNSGQMT